MWILKISLVLMMKSRALKGEEAERTGDLGIANTDDSRLPESTVRILCSLTAMKGVCLPRGINAVEGANQISSLDVGIPVLSTNLP